MTEAPLTTPGEVAGRPKLVLRYPTDPDRFAALLPPGLEPYGEPVVQIGIYCVVRDRHLGSLPPPASTALGVAALAAPGMLFEIEAVAALPA